MDTVRQGRRTGHRTVVLLVILLASLSAACRMPPFNLDLSLERAGVDSGPKNPTAAMPPGPALTFSINNSMVIPID
jgi:hypothetical protein